MIFSPNQQTLKMNEIFENFNNPENEIKIPYKILDVSCQREVHPYQKLEQFLQKYIDTLNHQPNQMYTNRKVTGNDKAENNTLYSSWKICYQQNETKKSKNQNFSSPKINTYIICPLCDPFKNLPNQTRYRTRGGDFGTSVAKEPLAYDTLHSHYFHHMSGVHGVFKDGTVAEQPFVGFSMTQVKKSTPPAVYDLCWICPYPKEHKSQLPCLKASEFDFTRDDPYKSYFRHVATCHHGKPNGKGRSNADKKILSKNSNTYQKLVKNNDGECFKNIFFPLSRKKFTESLKFLREKCGVSTLDPFLLCTDKHILQGIENYIEANGETSSEPVLIEEEQRDPVNAIQNNNKVFTGNIKVSPYYESYPRPRSLSESSRETSTKKRKTPPLPTILEDSKYPFAPEDFKFPVSRNTHSTNDNPADDAVIKGFEFPTATINNGNLQNQNIQFNSQSLSDAANPIEILNLRYFNMRGQCSMSGDLDSNQYGLNQDMSNQQISNQGLSIQQVSHQNLPFPQNSGAEKNLQFKVVFPGQITSGRPQQSQQDHDNCLITEEDKKLIDVVLKNEQHFDSLTNDGNYNVLQQNINEGDSIPFTNQTSQTEGSALVIGMEVPAAQEVSSFEYAQLLDVEEPCPFESELWSPYFSSSQLKNFTSQTNNNQSPNETEAPESDIDPSVFHGDLT